MIKRVLLSVSVVAVLLTAAEIGCLRTGEADPACSDPAGNHLTAGYIECCCPQGGHDPGLCHLTICVPWHTPTPEHDLALPPASDMTTPSDMGFIGCGALRHDIEALQSTQDKGIRMCHQQNWINAGVADPMSIRNYNVALDILYAFKFQGGCGCAAPVYGEVCAPGNFQRVDVDCTQAQIADPVGFAACYQRAFAYCFAH